MIRSKPQTGTFVSLLIFIVLSVALLGVNVFVVVTDRNPLWFNYIIVAVLLPIVIFVTYKVFFRYKNIIMGERAVEVRYPLFRFHKKYTLDQIRYWKESIVKTGKTTSYKELEVKFTDEKVIQMGHREYTEYDKMVKYLQQKIPGKKE